MREAEAQQIAAFINKVAENIDNDAVIELWLTQKYPADLWTRAFRGRNLGLEVIIAGAETVPYGARELVAERFGARLVNVAGASQDLDAQAARLVVLRVDLGRAAKQFHRLVQPALAGERMSGGMQGFRFYLQGPG